MAREHAGVVAAQCNLDMISLEKKQSRRNDWLYQFRLLGIWLNSKCTSSDDFIVSRALLSLKPKKQSLVFLSSTEAECVRYSEAQEQLLCSDTFIFKS